jgi:hypothetical protein
MWLSKMASPTSSDLIVPEQSQRDGVTLSGRYYWHSHMSFGVPEIFGETGSSVISDHVGRILSSRLDLINLPANGIYFPTAINGAHLFKLGQE